MTLVEAYLFLFFDSIMSVVIFVPNTEMVYKVMKFFPRYTEGYMVVIASIGVVAGSSINYIFGKALHSLKQRINHYEDSIKFKYLTQYVDQKLFWLLVLSLLPVIGSVTTTAAGFFRIKYYKVVLVILLSRIFYYVVLYNLF
jgi:membrane protein YqaA with SNARE-associated domain